MSGSGAGGGRGITWREQIASVWAAMSAAAAVPSASADRSIRLVVRPMPASSDSRLVALANGTAAAARAVILASPGDIEARSTPSSASRGTTPCPQPVQW